MWTISHGLSCKYLVPKWVAVVEDVKLLGEKSYHLIQSSLDSYRPVPPPEIQEVSPKLISTNPGQPPKLLWLQMCTATSGPTPTSYPSCLSPSCPLPCDWSCYTWISQFQHRAFSTMANCIPELWDKLSPTPLSCCGQTCESQSSKKGN